MDSSLMNHNDIKMEDLVSSDDPLDDPVPSIAPPTRDSGSTTDTNELRKQYYFGCGPLHPKWLQFLANKKFFTVLACCFTCLHSSIVSGYISVILSTIQTRYRSVEASFIVIAYDLTVAIFVTFATHFANQFHKPRVLGISCILLAITSLLYASPQFIFGRYQIGSTNNGLEEQCMDNRTVTLDCEASGNDAALSIFILSSILLSASSAILYTLTVIYIDEIVFPRYVPLHIGTFYAFQVIGPAFGFLIGSSCLSIYVDPWVDTVLTEADPAWVGAWWIPFIIVAVSAFLLAIPFLMFPKWLPDSYLVQEERKKLMAKVYANDKVQQGAGVIVFLKTFVVRIWRLCTNVSFMCASFGLAVVYILTQGVISFAPKFLENQFYLSSSVAGFVTGAVAIPAAVIGVVIGSVSTYIFKWNGKRNILFTSIVTLVSVPFLAVYLIHCPTVNLAGVITPYNNESSISGVDGLSCNRFCNCSSSVFEPICGSDGVTYFSSCRAGCTANMMDNTNVSYDYQNCSCISSMESSVNSTGSSYGGGTAMTGTCESTCILIAPMILLFFISVVISFMGIIPYQYYTIRVVSDEQRALALGLQSSIWRIFGAVPGPILFGSLFDLSCAIWQDECGRRGNCWLYYNNQLSNRVIAVAFPCVIVGGVLFFIAFLTYPKNRISDKENDSSF